MSPHCPSEAVDLRGRNLREGGTQVFLDHFASHGNEAREQRRQPAGALLADLQRQRLDDADQHAEGEVGGVVENSAEKHLDAPIAAVRAQREPDCGKMAATGEGQFLFAKTALRRMGLEKAV